ncbi:hypothetical protein [Allokutzneria sp. NRRL B-24872]|uniref:hypothetical protein n=1 Tax=Allokutzneria sp. NRRL B-24872 TaxID=1137961 RepID=UPI0011777893|nr:hypothetical protein [Allokutzneria sp. NRRL B-24872]
MRTARTVLGCAAVLAALAGCAAPSGVRVEGRAAEVERPAPTTIAGQPVTVDVVGLLRGDPKVNEKIKFMLSPCESGRYPVDSRYVDVTGDGVSEVVLNVQECRAVTYTAYGYNRAAYVYALPPGQPPAQLFAVEESGVVMQPDPGSGVVLVRGRYRAGDRSCCPSGEETTVYSWNGTAFVKAGR